VAMRDMTVRGEVEALRPLRNVTKPKVFEVELMWPEPRRSFLDVAFSKHDLDDVPFRVKRLDHRGELVPYVYPIS
jgi:hypothetical protein